MLDLSLVDWVPKLLWVSDWRKVGPLYRLAKLRTIPRAPKGQPWPPRSAGLAALEGGRVCTDQRLGAVVGPLLQHLTCLDRPRSDLPRDAQHLPVKKDQVQQDVRAMPSG